MKIFKNRKPKIGVASLFAMFAVATIVFACPTESESIRQDPVVTSKQIEALPQATSTVASSEDRIALYQALLDLTNPWTVMCVAAHPDDEDGTSLIVMRRKYGAHTVSLFSTFGEGGQNAIGPELYEELGAIRARETMAAAEIQGSEPHFLGLKDFGYSKSAAEAFKFWGHDEALRRMVLEIRKLRPDVIITNHSVNNNDHGHHQATARLVVEAFDAAADPKYFPEQLKNEVTTWQVQRLFVRVGRSNQAQADAGPVVTIDPNERDQIRGVVYAEEALRALQQHATQGPWPKTFAEFAARFRAFSGQSATPGQLPPIRYALVREAKGAQPLTNNADSFLAGLVIPRELVPRLAPVWSDQSWIPMNERALVLPRLFALAQGFHQANSPEAIRTLPRVAAMAKRLDAALAAAAGISAAVTPETEALVPGVPAKFKITVANHGSVDARLGAVDLGGMGMGSGRPASTQLVPVGQSVTIVREFQTPRDASMTVPHREHLYDGREFGERFTATVLVLVNGGSFQVPATVSMDVTPAVEIKSAEPSPLVLTPQTKDLPRSFRISVRSHMDTAFQGLLGVFAIASGSRNGVSGTLSLPLFSTSLSLSPRASQQEILKGSLTIKPLSDLVIRAQSDTSATRLVLSESSVRVITADASVANNLNVGYLRGFDFSLPNALNALGVESKELSVDEVKTADLSKFTSIIVDNRVYESQPELIAANQKLLDYANAGGNLIVFYHKSDEWNPDPRRNRPQLAPYKLILGNERITDENAPITFLEPDHPLLNGPNKINQDDFKGWIQERGLYYPKEWDPQFHALLESNDASEAPLKGGLLAADYGRGHYIYTSMVWYRELRAGVPGAYRMLANMISYGKGK